MTERITGQIVSPSVAAATVLKVGTGRAAMASVITAGAQGALHDCATTGAAASTNLIAAIPATVGNYLIDMPYWVGLTYVPGAAQVASISYV